MRRVALLAVACVALAGCTAPVGTTPPRTGPDDGTGTAPPNHSASPGPATATPAATIAFADLPADSQAAFETTRRPNGLAKFVPESPYIEGETFPPEAATPFVNHEFVEKDGTLFRIELTQGELYASYRIEASPATPGPNATVVDYENVAASRQNAVRAAIENGSYSTELGQWSTVGVDAAYVRYQNETYRLGIVTGDYWAKVLRIERA
jgi:hypothetical protein